MQQQPCLLDQLLRMSLLTKDIFVRMAFWPYCLPGTSSLQSIVLFPCNRLLPRLLVSPLRMANGWGSWQEGIRLQASAQGQFYLPIVPLLLHTTASATLFSRDKVPFHEVLHGRPPPHPAPGADPQGTY